MINIGLLGLGTVGTGVVEILNKRKDELKKITGQEIKIKRVLVKNLYKKRNVELEDGIITDDFNQILNDEDISIIIEATGAILDGYEYLTKSLDAGKHVVTANKALVSKYFGELLSLAYEKNLSFLYEASVGGGIPILKPFKEQLALNNFTDIKGILNGTCNYILTRMEEGLDYSEALKIAQQQGFAELDPTDDVEGIDTRRKLRILTSLAMQSNVTEDDILLYGISNIKDFDIEMIKSMNSKFKLIGEFKNTKDGYTAVVHPVIVSNDSYFANVNMEYNAISLTGDNVGKLNFYGPGAGKLPTANAILSDVLDIITGSYRLTNPFKKEKLTNLNSTIKGEYYLRISNGSEEVLNIMESIAARVLSTDENVAVITKSMLLEDIFNLLQVLQIERKNYFLAKRELD